MKPTTKYIIFIFVFTVSLVQLGREASNESHVFGKSLRTLFWKPVSSKTGSKSDNAEAGSSFKQKATAKTKDTVCKPGICTLDIIMHVLIAQVYVFRQNGTGCGIDIWQHPPASESCYDGKTPTSTWIWSNVTYPVLDVLAQVCCALTKETTAVLHRHVSLRLITIAFTITAQNYHISWAFLILKGRLGTFTAQKQGEDVYPSKTNTKSQLNSLKNALTNRTISVAPERDVPSGSAPTSRPKNYTKVCAEHVSQHIGRILPRNELHTVSDETVTPNRKVSNHTSHCAYHISRDRTHCCDHTHHPVSSLTRKQFFLQCVPRNTSSTERNRTLSSNPLSTRRHCGHADSIATASSWTLGVIHEPLIGSNVNTSYHGVGLSFVNSYTKSDVRSRTPLCHHTHPVLDLTFLHPYSSVSLDKGKRNLPHLYIIHALLNVFIFVCILFKLLDLRRGHLHSLVEKFFHDHEQTSKSSSNVREDCDSRKKREWTHYVDNPFGTSWIGQTENRNRKQKLKYVPFPNRCRWSSDSVCEECRELLEKQDLTSGENSHVVFESDSVAPYVLAKNGHTTTCGNRRIIHRTTCNNARHREKTASEKSHLTGIGSSRFKSERIIRCESCCKTWSTLWRKGFRPSESVSLVVYPARRFLPDTTNNPDQDLAHVGYRLATLSALPPTFPVSRVKLADSGFYYRGQGDELICYACQNRHSGWTNEDRPWDVHRRIAPRCPHVVERDREQAEQGQAFGGIPGAAALHQNIQVTQSQTTQVTSQGSLTQAGSSQSPMSPNSSVNRHHQMVNEHAERHFEDGDQTNEQSRMTSEQPRHPEARLSSMAVAQETMPPQYYRSQVFPRPTQSPAAGDQGQGTGTGQQPVTDARAGGPSLTGSAGTNTHSTASPGGAQRPQAASGQSSGPSGTQVPGSQGGVAEARHLFPRPGLDLGGAVYPMYQDMASRRRSFNSWDERRAPPLDQIILCGMFYAGYADCVRCFYCGVGLKHWEPTDDVWAEHIRWRPSCGYLKAIRGDDFIRRMQARLSREDNNDEDGPDSGPPGPPGPPPPQSNPPPPAPSSNPEPPRSQPSSSGSPAPSNPAPSCAPSGQQTQDRLQRGDNSSGNDASTVTNPSSPHGDGRTEPHGVPSAGGDVTHAQPATGESTQSHTMTTATVTSTAATAPSAPNPSATTATTSPPESCSSLQTSTRPEGGPERRPPEGESYAQRVERLQRENRELARRLRCRVCHRGNIDTIIMPCGHLALCEDCARNTTICPLCGDRIRATAKVHMS